MLLASLVVVPRVIDGRAALEWTRHLVGRGEAGPKAAPARQAARWAVRALERSAPLPYGGQAARLALDAGRDLEAAEPEVAREMASELRDAVEALPAWRRIGLSSLAREARDLEERSRNRMTPAPPAS